MALKLDDYTAAKDGFQRILWGRSDPDKKWKVLCVVEAHEPLHEALNHKVDGDLACDQARLADLKQGMPIQVDEIEGDDINEVVLREAGQPAF